MTLFFILSILAFLTMFVWLLYAGWLSTFSIMSLLSKIHKKKMTKEKTKNASFVVVSVASNGVRGSLYYVLDGLKKFGLKTFVVVDEGAELLGELRKDFPECNFVVVPKDFVCKAIAKGRAMEYFNRKKVKPSEWYVFLDDDSLPLDDKFLYEIDARDKEGYIGANGSLYPREGKNQYTYVIDFYRYIDDITFFTACQGFLKTPLCGFHGELLILKGDVMKEIGFDRKSITEDFSFATEVVKKHYKTWHSQTKVSIQSPNSFKDLLTQRARWTKGIAQDLKHASLKVKLIMGTLLLRAVIGIFSSVYFLILWFALWLFGIISLPFYPIFIVGTLYWIIAIFLLPKTSLKYKIMTVFVSPIEYFHLIYVFKMKKFKVIDKN